jgi:maleylpyruvate isomerase
VQLGNFRIDAPSDWRLALAGATQRLLGDTIALSDAGWQEQTALPGWSRAHIAAHLSHHARAIAVMAADLMATHRPVVWRTNLDDVTLNAEARQRSIALQESLDQSAAALNRSFEAMDDLAWQTSVITSQGSLPASSFIPDRINHLTIHNIDLDVGYDFTDIDPELARTLLQWNVYRASPRFNTVKLIIISDEGLSLTVGRGTPVEVRGTEANLLGWVTGRKNSSVVLGADELDLAGPA